ncbi:aromatic-ring-hydroxylating dioxygenase subunit beta [Streptomyces sp. NPDC050560]|uniref:aromatic-ring-hydroxylating dioxygenase subunit beta n=1 Tax=Streptomyces sp. NPDC050560 TaxID=3365630 RepID=UPI0037AD5BF4
MTGAGEGATVDLATRVEVEDLYYREAELLDERRWEEWLELFAPELEYTAPIRVTRRAPANDIIDDIGHFDETKSSLGLRVKRLRTDVAWAENPPSHTRRLITNVRVRRETGTGQLAARTNMMLFRSRGDHGAHDLIVGERRDTLRREGEAWLITRRVIILDQSSLGTKNLGVFL